GGGGTASSGSTPTGTTSTATSALRGAEATPRRGGLRLLSGSTPATTAGVPRSDAAGGGVLGTGAARLPVVNAVATTPQLPFTGLSLLVATLVGGSLLLAG